jgi:hypothetical protein
MTSPTSYIATLAVVIIPGLATCGDRSQSERKANAYMDVECYCTVNVPQGRGQVHNTTHGCPFHHSQLD